MTIVEFLEARIAEDEVIASQAAKQDSSSGNRGPGMWWVENEGADAHPGATTSIGGCRVYTRGDAGSNRSWTLASVQHMARHDPARVLRECAAKWAIIESAKRTHDDWENGTGASYDYEQWLVYKESILPGLAAIYADHADFDPSWSA